MVLLSAVHRVATLRALELQSHNRSMRVRPLLTRLCIAPAIRCKQFSSTEGWRWIPPIPPDVSCKATAFSVKGRGIDVRLGGGGAVPVTCWSREGCDAHIRSRPHAVVGWCLRDAALCGRVRGRYQYLHKPIDGDTHSDIASNSDAHCTSDLHADANTNLDDHPASDADAN
jgi:hypothetical protein